MLFRLLVGAVEEPHTLIHVRSLVDRRLAQVWLRHGGRNPQRRLEVQHLFGVKPIKVSDDGDGHARKRNFNLVLKPIRPNRDAMFAQRQALGDHAANHRPFSLALRVGRKGGQGLIFVVRDLGAVFERQRRIKQPRAHAFLNRRAPVHCAAHDRLVAQQALQHPQAGGRKPRVEGRRRQMRYPMLFKAVHRQCSMCS